MVINQKNGFITTRLKIVGFLFLGRLRLICLLSFVFSFLYRSVHSSVQIKVKGLPLYILYIRMIHVFCKKNT